MEPAIYLVHSWNFLENITILRYGEVLTQDHRSSQTIDQDNNVYRNSSG